jgi:hypothetical protein
MYQFQEEFYRVMTRLKANSRAASSTTIQLPEARVWEMDSNGVLVSKPLKKVEEVSETKTKQTSEPQVWDLKKSKAASIIGINTLTPSSDTSRCFTRWR